MQVLDKLYFSPAKPPIFDQPPTLMTNRPDWMLDRAEVETPKEAPTKICVSPNLETI